MNIILTRTKDEHLNVSWEPFATSTPLKAIPSNAKVVNGLQKQLMIHNDSPDFIGKFQEDCRTWRMCQRESAESKQLISKKTRKKSATYFDLASSSDEDISSENKRPIIKLKPGKKTKSILINKNLNDGKAKIIEEIVTNKEINHCTKKENMNTKDCEMNTVLNVEGKKSGKIRPKNTKNETINSTVELDSNFSDNSLSSDGESSKIFDETKKTNVTKAITSYPENKENTVNNSKNNESLKYFIASEETEKKLKKKKCIRNPVLTKTVQKSNIYDSQNLNISQSTTPEYNKSCKIQKRKSKDTESTIGYVKKTRTKKASDKLVDMPVENSKTLPLIWEHKSNLSHQLFSDSREQELINILDLTSEEIGEKSQTIKNSLLKKGKEMPYASFVSSHPSNSKDLIQSEFVQNWPKRKKQNSQKFIKSENSSTNDFFMNIYTKKQVKCEKNPEIKARNDMVIKESHMLQKSDVFTGKICEGNLIKNDKKNLKIKRKPKRKTTTSHEKNKISSAVDDISKSVSSISESTLRNTEVNNALSAAGSSTDNNEVGESNKPQAVEKDKKAISEKPVFKLLNELLYKENKLGCSVAQCWNVNNFKCGLFKLKVKSQLTCKTLHCNSYLGGVLIKGNLKMKIGDRELALTEGDTVCVPPLTEWQATNIGNCETLFYYWCGRFNVN